MLDLVEEHERELYAHIHSRGEACALLSGAREGLGIPQEMTKRLRASANSIARYENRVHIHQTGRDPIYRSKKGATYTTALTNDPTSLPHHPSSLLPNTALLTLLPAPNHLPPLPLQNPKPTPIPPPPPEPQLLPIPALLPKSQPRIQLPRPLIPLKSPHADSMQPSRLKSPPQRPADSFAPVPFPLIRLEDIDSQLAEAVGVERLSKENDSYRLRIGGGGRARGRLEADYDAEEEGADLVEVVEGGLPRGRVLGADAGVLPRGGFLKGLEEGVVGRGFRGAVEEVAGVEGEVGGGGHLEQVVTLFQSDVLTSLWW